MNLEFKPLANKYSRWYFSITQNRKDNPITGYTENHHIQPECLGGTRSTDNMVRLSAREHYICHLLLTKMLVGEPKKRMAFAFRSMHRKKNDMERYIPSSYIYQITREAIDFKPGEETRRKMSESGKKRPPITEITRKNLSNSVKDSYTQDLRALRSQQFKNQIFTESHRSKLSESRTGMIRTEESKQKQGQTLRGGNSHRCKIWTLQSPQGQTFITKDMTSFCGEHNLNYSSLRNRAREKSHVPLTKGLSKGWVVISCV
ncbi:hypothetical protein [Acinetobacter sp.]|uniref:hypothetical protein n=1 Tax=Acinetobacter sp. TaxID=472 RepID=UPI00388F4CBB